MVSGRIAIRTVTVSNTIDATASEPAFLNVFAASPPALTLMTYNLHGNGTLNWSTGTTDVFAMLDGVTSGQSINQIKSNLEDINREPGSKKQLWKVDGFNDN